jgi:hypothetical protein
MSSAARIDELLSKFAENPRRYFAPLANEYRKAGDLAQAIALCREHLPNQPHHMSGHIVLGQALYEHGEQAEALSVFEAALALDPENLIALRHLGDIARLRGDASAARRWYGRVLDADPRNDDIAALLASLAARATPRDVTPVSMPEVVAAEPEVVWPVADAPAPAAVDDLLDLDGFLESSAPVRSSADETADVEAMLAHGVSAVAPTPDGDADPLEGVEMLEPMLVPDRSVVPSTDMSALEEPIIGEVLRPSITEALDVFASHDPLEAHDALPFEVPTMPSGSDPVPSGEVVEGAAERVEPSFDDEMVEIEWPDASTLGTRARTPSMGTGITEPDDMPDDMPADAVGGEPGEADAADIELPVFVASVAPDSTHADEPHALDPAGLGEAAAVEAALDLDEDPPLTAAEIPWLSVPEAEQEALGEVTDVEGAPAFVTETMAELFVAQGFVDRAIGVYGQLLARRPDDALLAARLAELHARVEAPTPTPASPSYATVPRADTPRADTPRADTPRADTPRATPRITPFVATLPERTARAWLSGLAARRVARRTPAVGAGSVLMPTPADGLAGLFGASPTQTEDVAARSIASAFGGGAPLDTGRSLFDDLGEAVPEHPSHVRRDGSPAAGGAAAIDELARASAAADSALFSFDRLFPDPATAGAAPDALVERHLTPAAPSAPPDESPSPAATLGDFSAWLKGLTNS